MTLAQFDFGTIKFLLLKLSLILVKHTYQDFLIKHIFPDIPLAFCDYNEHKQDTLSFYYLRTYSSRAVPVKRKQPRL